MMVLSLGATGILEITILYLVVKIVNTEFGTSMAVNFIVPPHMIM
jgi:hypothetical protein